MYYFGYGANILDKEMNKYINKNDYDFISYGFLPDYSFKYRVISDSEKGFANIEPVKNENTYGKVYKIHNDSLKNIFEKEGYISNDNQENKYDLKIVKVNSIDEKTSYDCYVFIMNPLKVGKEKEPYEYYRNKIIEGIEEMIEYETSHIDRVRYLI